jgi:hypothetical protein
MQNHGKAKNIKLESQTYIITQGSRSSAGSSSFLVQKLYNCVHIPTTVIIFTVLLVLWEKLQCRIARYSKPVRVKTNLMSKNPDQIQNALYSHRTTQDQNKKYSSSDSNISKKKCDM